ncbi:UNVERIFIED_CONTAM: hypothetical protein HDU68_003931 [Siphonaria sp. JEL0065]|nr:hypothetical protein HDU68_003931 [Siphonaria sp. JEL0065]
MRALVAQKVNSSDPIDELSIQDSFPVPVPTGTQVLVKMKAASVNPADIMYINGTYEHAPAHPMPKFPCALGVDGSGIVESTGPSATRWKQGDHVMGGHHLMIAGSFAEFALFDECELVAKPPSLSWEVAASIPLVWITALSAFHCDSRFKAITNQVMGQPPPVNRVLIIGASGGIGSAAVILAKHYFKVPMVIAVCSGRNVEYCKSLGADQVIDYTRENVVKVLAVDPVDFCLDNVGGGTLSDALMVDGGVLVSNVPGSRNSGFLSALWFFARIGLHNLTSTRSKIVFNGASTRGPFLGRVVEFLGEHPELCGLMRVQSFKFEDGVDALKVVASGRTVGKSVILIGC